MSNQPNADSEKGDSEQDNDTTEDFNNTSNSTQSYSQIPITNFSPQGADMLPFQYISYQSQNNIASYNNGLNWNGVSSHVPETQRLTPQYHNCFPFPTQVEHRDGNYSSYADPRRYWHMPQQLRGSSGGPDGMVSQNQVPQMYFPQMPAPFPVMSSQLDSRFRPPPHLYDPRRMCQPGLFAVQQPNTGIINSQLLPPPPEPRVQQHQRVHAMHNSPVNFTASTPHVNELYTQSQGNVSVMSSNGIAAGSDWDSLLAKAKDVIKDGCGEEKGSQGASSKRKSLKKSCEHEGCTKQSSFNYEWESKARFCSAHKLLDMVDVKHKSCEIAGCSKQPYFNYESIRKGRFCATHKLPGMVNVKHKSCEAPGCDKQPSFNYQGLCIGVYCSVHKLQKMVNVKNKICAAEGCAKVPSYNFAKEPKALYCSTHKLENMVDVISKRCEASGCTKRPSFNYKGQTGCRFCASHKLEGMVDIISRICEVEGCEKNASCNYKGLTRRRFCSTHKLHNMVNIIVNSKESSQGGNLSRKKPKTSHSSN